ncbi:cathepsin L-like [Drosophila innubila]|uniref:cathepsin L-like n=1 Tax=Drosophila innubila TaxID=198719 RepID=UPI00148D9D93|nr:cathepsin L-like [Drosophila innubila]
MKIIIAFLALIGYVQAISYADVLESEWNTFKTEYGKIYENKDEEQLRRQIFIDNKEMIDKHNKLYIAGEETYEMGVNQFTDLLAKEFESLMLPSHNITESDSLTDFIYTQPEDVAIPSSIDWRSKGAVTGVKDQGQCGSCWAFAAVGTLESQHFIKNRQLISLSEQNLLDCSSRAPFSNHGCDGGSHARALQYIQINGGIDTEQSYPYRATQQSCRFDKRFIGATVRAIARVQVNSESSLAAAVAITGPLSASIHVSRNMQFYRGGVFNDPSCDKPTNHAVTVVGYGHDNQGGDYWLVKNSWGSAWGESGYIRMSRNRNNQCRIASNAFYPLV